MEKARKLREEMKKQYEYAPYGATHLLKSQKLTKVTVTLVPEKIPPLS